MSVLTRMGDCRLSKALGTAEAAAAPREEYRGVCSYCRSDTPVRQVRHLPLRPVRAALAAQRLHRDADALLTGPAVLQPSR